MKVTAKQLAQTLYDLTDGKSKAEIEKSVAGFAEFLRNNRKLKISEKIIEQFAKIYNRQNGVVEAEITTREKLDESELKKMKEYVKKRYGAKEIILNNIVDASVKGGFVLKIWDEVIDNSMSGKLGQLRKLLTS